MSLAEMQRQYVTSAQNGPVGQTGTSVQNSTAQRISVSTMLMVTSQYTTTTEIVVFFIIVLAFSIPFITAVWCCYLRWKYLHSLKEKPVQKQPKRNSLGSTKGSLLTAKLLVSAVNELCQDDVESVESSDSVDLKDKPVEEEPPRWSLTSTKGSLLPAKLLVTAVNDLYQDAVGSVESLEYVEGVGSSASSSSLESTNESSNKEKAGQDESTNEANIVADKLTTQAVLLSDSRI